ncbi:YybH family protein [Streptomyces sp. NPDC059176]|uniref:YybH family protein n=1 Tax=unclassified Streptomyces TaxID=2593676 RepID=UPI0036756F1C
MTAALENVELTDDATEITEIYMKAFNSGNPDVVNQLYTDTAVSVWEPGHPITGQARKDALAEFLALKPKMTAKLRHSYVAGDAALLVVDWQIDVTNAEGEAEHHEGIGNDVLRLGADGKWRFAIDHPYGN